MDPMAGARAKLTAAFEFFKKLGIPYYCFHDRDVAPEGASFAESGPTSMRSRTRPPGTRSRLASRLLWGTANLFSHPRYRPAPRPTRTPRSSPTPRRR